MTVSSAKRSSGVQSQNYVINGGFDIWQRGTSFSAVGNTTFTADRFRGAGYSGSGSTFSRQSFTPGELVANTFGDAQFYLRANSTNAQIYFDERIEDVRTLAGQVATLSFWAKAGSALTLSSNLFQGFGSGGSSDNVFTNKNNSITTSWQRFTHTFTVPGVSGKTIGAGSFLSPYFVSTTLNTNLDIWGIQLEAGPVATPFRRHAPSIQGELAACQRYYQEHSSANSYYTTGAIVNSTDVVFAYPLITSMRVAPSISFSSTSDFNLIGAASSTISSFVGTTGSNGLISFYAVSSGLSAGQARMLFANNANARIRLSTEL
jgi:hypothetical protein